MRVRALAKLVAWLLLGVLLYTWLAPKIWLLPPRLTNNNWNREIVYRSSDGDTAVHCIFYSHDSLPYWEGDNYWEDEQVQEDSKGTFPRSAAAGRSRLDQ